jgi:hypothetical protein
MFSTLQAGQNTMQLGLDLLGLRGRRYIDDRIPTMEILRKPLEYHGRRTKAIVYIMASSGIRL